MLQRRGQVGGGGLTAAGDVRRGTLRRQRLGMTIGGNAELILAALLVDVGAGGAVGLNFGWISVSRTR